MSEPQPIRFSVPEEGFDLSLLLEAARQRSSEAFREAVTSYDKDAYREACQPTSKTEPLPMSPEPIQKRGGGGDGHGGAGALPRISAKPLMRCSLGSGPRLHRLSK
jgi:hypothetical protein